MKVIAAVVGVALIVQGILFIPALYRAGWQHHSRPGATIKGVIYSLVSLRRGSDEIAG